MVRFSSMIAARCAVLFGALALMLIPFAHPADRSDPPAMTPDLVAYLATGGTIADLCLSDHGSQDMARTDCPACHLAQMLYVPDAEQLVVDVVGDTGRRLLPCGQATVIAQAAQGPPVRGPPPLVI